MNVAIVIGAQLMSKKWAERQRRTNKLARLLARYILQNANVTPDQFYGLCKLTWISQTDDEDHQAYIDSTKIPALGLVLQRNYSGWDLTAVAKDVAKTVGDPTADRLVQSHTGFTNLYKAYRNSCREWLADHFKKIQVIVRKAVNLGPDSNPQSDQTGLEIMRSIMELPSVPNSNPERPPMRPQNLLTPLVFVLDGRLRFPLINKNKGVQTVLKKLDSTNKPLDQQYLAMVGLIGKHGIRDAADLDQLGSDLASIIGTETAQSTTKFLTEKPLEGNDLRIKDEGDVEVLQKARILMHRRRHNELTNTLLKCLDSHYLLEGIDGDALYDVLVKNYDGSDADLLIEAKSSVELAHIRMAIGQLFDYWFKIKGECKPHLAILLPERPDQLCVDMLKWLNIGVLWIEEGQLKTCTDSLCDLCSNAGASL